MKVLKGVIHILKGQTVNVKLVGFFFQNKKLLSKRQKDQSTFLRLMEMSIHVFFRSSLRRLRFVFA